MKTHFHFYADSSHGWLMVTEDDMRAVGLTVADFGQFSYVNHGRFYLEEDCDAALFLIAYKAKTGKDAELVEHYDDGQSLIRNYTRLPNTGRPFDHWCERLRSYEDMIAAADPVFAEQRRQARREVANNY